MNKETEPFTEANFENLKESCNRVASLCDKPEIGLFSYMTVLGQKLITLLENPIIKDSGILDNIKPK